MARTIWRALGLRLTHPAISGLIGLISWAAATAFAHPDLAEPGEEGLTIGNWAVLVQIALIGYALTCGIGSWGRAGSLGRLASVGGSISVASLVLVIAPWSGWPNILGATAVGMAVELRSKAGQLTPANLLSGALAAATFTTATVWSAFFP